jgi:lipid II:glycine glycyltransferase (peptidoglycan interpeptide bridge formation enzyme)
LSKRGPVRDIEVVPGVDETSWRDFVDRRRDASIFHTPEMARVLGDCRGHRVVPWAARERGGSVRALFVPVEITLMRGALRSWTSRAVVYGGVLADDAPSGADATRALLDTYKASGGGAALFTEVRHQCDVSALAPVLRSVGFSHEGHLNYLISLRRREADLWQSLTRSAKQRIKSAEKKGVVVDEATDRADCDAAYDLLESVYRRVRVPLASRELFAAAMQLLHPRGMFRIVTARVDGRMIGARFLLVHRGRIIDWYAGSDRAYASWSPNEVLVWHVLRWGVEHGFEVFDFGGAGRPDEPYGPREFKAKFGGELVDFGRDVMVHAPGRLRASRMGYAAARRLPRRVAAEPAR